MLEFVILILASYLFGAVPFGLLIARAKGIDLRTVGSGNIGATNVSRALGRKWGYTCFSLDLLKGLLPMLAARLLLLPEHPNTALLCLWLLVGIAAILGHVFPVYLKFKGGKGVATSLGVILGLWPYLTIPGLLAFASWAVIVAISRYISLGSILAAVLFPVYFMLIIMLCPAWNFTALWPVFIISCIVSLLLILRHKDNIKRLLAGSENKINMNIFGR
jgi:glycerol-3-phosphate acyltransferase PlsY